MTKDSDQIGWYLTQIRKFTEGLRDFTLEVENNEISYLDSNVEIAPPHQAYGAIENLVKCLPSGDPLVVIICSEATAFISSLTHEAEINDDIVFIWPTATDGLKQLDPKIIKSGKPATQSQIDQLPDLIFLDSDGKKLIVEQLQSLVIDNHRHSLDERETENIQESYVDDVLDAYIDSCLGDDYEDASIFITKFRLPNGKEVRSSISRSKASEKSEPVMTYHELLAV